MRCISNAGTLKKEGHYKRKKSRFLGLKSGFEKLHVFCIFDHNLLFQINSLCIPVVVLLNIANCLLVSVFEKSIIGACQHLKPF